MMDIKDIWDTDWNTDNVAKPALIKEPENVRYYYRRVLSSKKLEKIEDYMGIFSKSYYTPESHDAFECWACAESESDCEAIIDEARRICAKTEYKKIIKWEGGDWSFVSPYRWEFRFIVMIKKSGTVIPNAV